MRDNTKLIAGLIATGKISIEGSPLLDRVPEPITLPPDQLWDRVEGMMLGLAVGDALGNTSESMLPGARLERNGEIRDYRPNWKAEDRTVGLPSDDSQMAFWTLEQLLEDDGLVPENLAERFTRQRIFGIGSTVREFLRRYREQGVPWEEAGVASMGNGALMRIAPVLIPHLGRPSAALWADAAIAGKITHDDPGSIAACVAFVSLLWEATRRVDSPEPGWWVETLLATLVPLEGETSYESRQSPIQYKGSLGGFIERHVPEALEAGLSARQACDSWHSGAYLLETLPSVIFILARHGHDPEEAIVRAVNDTRDNDTVAAIVGAAVGALHGRRALPSRWIGGLLGRTAESDDGAVFALLERARERWGRGRSPE